MDGDVTTWDHLGWVPGLRNRMVRNIKANFLFEHGLHKLTYHS